MESIIENIMLWVLGILDYAKYTFKKIFSSIKKNFTIIVSFSLAVIFVYSFVIVASIAQTKAASPKKIIHTIDSVSEKIETTTVELEDNYSLTKGEIELIALVTMGEAESEPERGQRLVIDTILNRVDSKVFPNSVKDVVYQPNQFEAIWNGRIERCYVDEDICELVKEELIERESENVIFFRTEKYSIYGTPMFKVGNHYFSTL